MEQILVDIFCDIDDFCNDFEEYWYKHLVTDGRKIIPKCNMFLIMTIVILFHLSNQRTFKWYYKNLVCGYWKDYLPKRLSYNRFVEVMQSAVVPLLVYTMKYRTGKRNGISFIDSTKIAVCGNKRISRNKVFKDTAKILGGFMASSYI